MLIKNTNPAQFPAVPQRDEPPSPQTGPSVTSRCASHHGYSCCTLQRGDISQIFDTELVPRPQTKQEQRKPHKEMEGHRFAQRVAGEGEMKGLRVSPKDKSS